jgi:hypothetical protein
LREGRMALVVLLLKLLLLWAVVSESRVGHGASLLW